MASQNELDPDQQSASALASTLSQLSNNSGNNPVYLVRIEDPESKPKIRRFLVSKKPLYDSSSINFQGFELQGKANLEELITRERITVFAKDKSLKAYDLIVPWQRVVCVEQLSYQTKQKQL